MFRYEKKFWIDQTSNRGLQNGESKIKRGLDLSVHYDTIIFPAVHLLHLMFFLILMDLIVQYYIGSVCRNEFKAVAHVTIDEFIIRKSKLNSVPDFRVMHLIFELHGRFHDNAFYFYKSLDM